MVAIKLLALLVAMDVAAADVTQCLGVNIHTLSPAVGELQMIADAGIHWVRMDLAWPTVEPSTAGVYDFREVDAFVAALGGAGDGLRWVAIVSPSNPLYDGGANVVSEAGQAAFGKVVAALAARYADVAARGALLLELVNEPNSWPAYKNATNYARLVHHAASAVQAAGAPRILAGPASANIDFDWLRELLELGVLRDIDHLTVHPYRSDGPETALTDLASLQGLVAEYAPPASAPMPVSSGEWGYASHPTGGSQIPDVVAHGKVVSRLYLTTIAARVPISIYYDWRDGAPELMGLVYQDAAPAASAWPRVPKPAYNATRALASALAGLEFVDRLPVFQNGRDASDDWLLRFQAPAGDSSASGTSSASDTAPVDTVLVAWTSGSFGHVIRIPGGSGCFSAADWVGNALPEVCAGDRGLHVNVTDAPVFLSQRGSAVTSR